MNETLIRLGYTVAGFTTAWLLSSIKYKIDNIENALVQLDKAIPTPEEMAQEVLKVKLPLNKVPPDVLENLKKSLKDMKKGEKTNTDSPSYMG